MAVAQDDRQSIHYYSLSSQVMAEREAYYDVLERCQKGKGDITEWLTVKKPYVKERIGVAIRDELLKVTSSKA